MSANSPDLAWVRPPEPIRGLDHLGVQAPCIALYAQLLPGITNVTDRARYYSFHPWVIWSFETRYKDHSVEEFRRVLRRAECLFALIAIRHSRVLKTADEGLHGAGMVGRFELLRVSEEAAIALDDFAGLDGPHRYFKNKLGGLGQYYFGPLRDLRVLDHASEGAVGLPGYDRQRGKALAEAFANGVPGDAFFTLLEAPTFSWADLDGLAMFCPCHLSANSVELELLLDVFLARSSDYQGEVAETRRASLALLLDLCARNAGAEHHFEDLFRAATYSGALSDGSPWAVDAPLTRVRQAWGTYQRNELLSLATQGLFAAILRAIERDHGGRIGSVAETATVGARLLAGLGSTLTRPLSEVVAEVRGGLPKLEDWQDTNHELQRGWALHSLRLDDENLEKVAAESIAILLALLARGVDEAPYADFEFLDPEYFDPREVHLLSLRHAARTDWAKLTVDEWVRWLSVRWCVGRHLRVALRKLRGDRRDTFRIRPLEGELRVVEAPQPTYTIPRVGKTLQMLRDLGLTSVNKDGATVLTDRGRLELEGCVGK